MQATDDDLDVLSAKVTRYEREVLRRTLVSDLHAFVKAAWPLVEPETPFVDNWHVRALCRVLERVSRGELKRVIINVPPGSSKSLLVSVFFCAWEWASRPSLRYLTASYGSHLTVRDNLRVRLIVQSEWYQSLFNVALADDENQKTRFATIDGGWRLASSVGGVGTGEHPDRIIIDDPLTAEQARSEVERSTVNYWFDRTMASRGVARDTAIIIVMQRLHMEDLCAHLLARGGEWTHVCWPMRFAPERRDPLDPRTQPGELLWPALFTEEKVRRLELDLGPYGSASQLAQIPAPEGGGLFRREWFKFVDASPRQATRIRGWDTAGSEGKGDYTVGVKIAKVGGIWFVEDVVRGRWGPAGVDQVMRATAEADGRGCLQREEREGGASGKAMAAAHARLLVGYDYADVALGADKVTRARPFRAQCEAGNVYLVRGAWVEAFLQEIAEFPVGGHDDQVDAASCAFNAGLLEEKTLVDLTVGPSSVGGGRSYWQGPQ